MSLRGQGLKLFPALHTRPRRDSRQSPFSGMQFPVLSVCEQLQVRLGVIAAVVVAVMDMMSCWNWPMLRGPDGMVKEVAGGIVVVPHSCVSVVTLAVELEPCGWTGAGIGEHPSSVSPGLIEPATHHPCSLTAMRWLGVQRSTPALVVITKVERLTPVRRAALTRRHPWRVATRSPTHTRSIGTSPRAVMTGVPFATHQAPDKLAPRSRSGRSAEYP